MKKNEMNKKSKEYAEALVRLFFFKKCLKCEISGNPCSFNCPYQYMAGNMGEIIKAIEVILKEGGVENYNE